MKKLKIILLSVVFVSISVEYGCASRAAIKQYKESEWVYIGNGTDLEKYLTTKNIKFEVNPMGGVFVERSVYKIINDQMRTAFILCVAIPFDVATYPFQLMGFDHWPSSSNRSIITNDSSGESNGNWANLVGGLLHAGFNHW